MRETNIIGIYKPTGAVNGWLFVYAIVVKKISNGQLLVRDLYTGATFVLGFNCTYFHIQTTQLNVPISFQITGNRRSRYSYRAKNRSLASTKRTRVVHTNRNEIIAPQWAPDYVKHPKRKTSLNPVVSTLWRSSCLSKKRWCQLHKKMLKRQAANFRRHEKC